MTNKKSCCDFFTKIFKKEKGQSETIKSVNCNVKTSFEEHTEIKGNRNFIKEESKKNNDLSSNGSIKIIDNDPSSFFYDKNSALVEATDKNKALENLKEAYGIINKDQKDESETIPNKNQLKSKEIFTKVIVGINFKEILEGEGSIILSERSDINYTNSIAAND